MTDPCDNGICNTELVKGVAVVKCMYCKKVTDTYDIEYRAGHKKEKVLAFFAKMPCVQCYKDGVPIPPPIEVDEDDDD